METLEQLSRRVAELDPNWAKPGMRCIDPKMGYTFRAVGGADNMGNPCIEWAHESKFGATIGRAGVNLVAEAIATGPDASDAATLGAILLGLPDSAQVRKAQDTGLWFVLVDGPRFLLGPRCESRAEAILRAEVARLEAMVAHASRGE